MSCTCFPRTVPRRTSSRNNSPELKWTTPHSFSNRLESKPFPLPGPPTIKIMDAGALPKIRSELRKNS
eukprot:scaffold11634_cov109-Cylindrotheca_fusiformis.AAC.8